MADARLAKRMMMIKTIVGWTNFVGGLVLVLANFCDLPVHPVIFASTGPFLWAGLFEKYYGPLEVYF